MERARHFLVGYAACRQLSFGYLDLAWHGIREALPEDLDAKAFEEEAWAKAVLLPAAPAPCLMSTSFGHIFSGGYSAGYYGYKWAEVLDADAFAAFQEEGIFSQETAERFRREILAQGDKRDAVIQGDRTGRTITVAAPHVTIKHLTVTKSGISLPNMDAGIFLDKAADAAHIPEEVVGRPPYIALGVVAARLGRFPPLFNRSGH